MKNILKKFLKTLDKQFRKCYSNIVKKSKLVKRERVVTMTDTKKITDKKFSEMTIAEKHLVVYALLKKFGVTGEILQFEMERAEMAAKKSAKAKAKPTATQIEAEALKVAIVEFLESVGTPVRASEVYKALELSSPQKATHLLSALTKEKKIVRHEDKKIVTFTVAE